jgi:hypothetical protein
MRLVQGQLRGTLPGDFLRGLERASIETPSESGYLTESLPRMTKREKVVLPGA